MKGGRLTLEPIENNGKTRKFEEESSANRGTGREKDRGERPKAELGIGAI